MHSTISKHTFRGHTWKLLSLILIVSFVFAGSAFAQTTSGSSLDSVREVLQHFVSLMSRGWVVLAALAGKLMTNDWVFGSALHMDIYLWKIWNIMKNFANFALIAFLLGTLIKNLIGKEKMDIKSLITKTLVAGILIQASWFMMGALIDVSTVAVSAIGAFPGSFMQNDVGFKTYMEDEVKKIRQIKVVVDLQDTTNISLDNTSNDTIQSPMTEEDVFDTLMPDANSLGGPLIFLGMSTFRFYEYLDHSQSGGTTPSTLVINFGLKTIVLIMFSLALLLLLIANIVRVAYLRIFIIASPFIILFKVFDKENMMGKEGIAKYLSLSSLLDLVFKPVLFMASISLILVFVISMRNIMTTSPSTLEINGVTMSANANDKSATLGVQGAGSITVNDNIFGDLGNTSKSMFVDLILFFFTIFLMWKLVTWSLTSGSGPIKSAMTPLVQFAEGMAKNAPILGGQSFTSFKAGAEESIKQLAGSFNMTTEGKFTEGEDVLRSKINRFLNLPDPWTQKDYTTLMASAKTDDENTFFQKAKTIGHARDGGLSISKTQWRKPLEARLTNNSISLTANGRGSAYTGDLDSFLGKEGTTKLEPNVAKKNREKLHSLMGGWEKAVGQTTKSGTPEYKDLITMQYGRGESASSESASEPSEGE